MINNRTTGSGGLSTDTWIVQEAGMYYLSAAAIDSQLNTVKTLVTMRQGSQ